VCCTEEKNVSKCKSYVFKCVDVLISYFYTPVVY
jgi:hypothetical protein